MEAGYSIAYVAEAEVIHLHDETAGQVYNRYRREAIAMKQILPNSSFSWRHFLRMWLGMAVSDLFRARREGVLSKNWWAIIGFRLVQYWGTYRGYHYSGKIDAQLHRTFYYPPNVLDEKIAAPRRVQPIPYEEAKDLPKP